MHKTAILILLSFCCTFAQGQQAQTSDLTLAPSLQRRAPEYRIGRDDVLTITFPLTTEFNQTVTVQPDGFISLMDGVSLRVQGLTIPEFTEQLRTAYHSVLHDPVIGIDVKDFQKPIFTIFGQVNKPGEYELRRDTTLPEAMALGGGLAPTSRTQVFLMRRMPGTSQFEVKKINLRLTLQGKVVEEQVYLQPGDVVFVPEKFITKFKKYVTYGGVGGVGYWNPIQ
jgi:polysaccharide export outer membrane protein